MRRLALLLLLLPVAACESEPADTTAPPASASTTTQPTPTTSTSQPTPSTTTTPPVTTADLTSLAGLRYREVLGGVDFPMIVTPWTLDTSLLGLRDGRVFAFDGTRLSDSPLFDLEVSTDGERGLLGLTADPDDADLVHVHYSDPAGDTVVSTIDLAGGGERVLLTVEQPASNHNGGMLQFGPDGVLYLGLGDGGGANDRYGHGQNTATLLGGIVRIDPTSAESSLWSYGLRNPYRFWFDGEILYIGDVGQNAFEEVDVVAHRSDGYNFGWPITEGLHCFSPRSGCDLTGLTLPVLEVAHGDAGTCSVTGGVVYRGRAIPEITGHYFYSDYCGGWLRSFRFDGSGAADQRDWTDDVGVPGRIVSLGVDHTGEMYVLTTTAVLRVEPVR